MKRKVIEAIAIIMSLSILYGCGTSNVDSSQEASSAASTSVAIEYADNDFLSDLKLALQSRWKLNDELDDKYENGFSSLSEYADSMTQLAQTELDILEEYRNKPFNDSELQEKAISYINCLNDQIEAMKIEVTDEEKADEQWADAYNERTKLIEDFVDDYGFSVDEDYQSNLDELLANSSAVKREEENQEAIDALVNSIEFEETNDDGYGWKTYSAVVENTTDLDFSEFDINVNLLDSDGVIIESQYVTLNNYKAGDKARFEFETDADFNSTDVSLSYYDLND